MKLIKLFILFTISIASFVFIDQNHVNAVTTCEVITTSSPCKSEGLTEVPDGETAKCPEGFNFEGCSNKPQKGSGVVLCCHNPALVSSGKECEPQKKEDDKYYLCMTKEACSNVSGTEVAEKSTPSVCTGGGSHKEICCQTPARKGETVKDDTSKPVPQTGSTEWNYGGESGGLKLVSCTKSGDCEIKDIVQQGIYFADFLIGLSGALFLIAFIWGGTMYLLSFGRDAWVTKGRDAMVKSAIGIVFIMLAWTIVTYVADSLGYTPIKSGGGNTPKQDKGGGNTPDQGAGAGTGTGKCKCSGTISAGMLLPNATFDSYCSNVASYCSSCGNGKATCTVELDIPKESCESNNFTAMAESFGVPKEALSLVNLSGSCKYNE